MTSSNFTEQLVQAVKETEQVVCSYLPEEEGFQKTIFESMNYSVKAGGKRIRPLFMREVYRLFGGSGTEIEPFMAAIEMIHTSSLVHDDLPCMDNDEYRRGRPTTWKMYGEDMAVLAGDALMIYAFETAVKAFQTGADAARVGRAVGILAEKTGIYGMIGGQTVDVELTGKPVSRGQLSFIYRLKTGALLEAAMMIGALLGGADERQLAAVEQMAADVGMAFQIRDDILDVTGTQEALGKPVLSDEKNEKTTYVTLEGLERAKEAVNEVSERALSTLETLPGEHSFLKELIGLLASREK